MLHIDTTALANEILKAHTDFKNVEVHVHPSLIELLEKVHQLRPEIAFSPTDSGRYKYPEGYVRGAPCNDPLIMKALHVEARINGEYVGKIYYSQHEDNFEITPQRPEFKNRNGYKRTKDPKIALQFIAKSFVIKGDDEKIENSLDNVSGYKRMVFGAARRDCVEVLGNNLFDVIGVLRRHMHELGVPPEAEEAYTKFFDEYEVAFHLNKSNVTVLQEESTYYLIKNKEQYSKLQAHELPEFVARGIGMLKLVEKGQRIPGVGARVGASLFHLVSPT